MSDCIFCKIINGEISSKKVFEDDDVVCFNDIHPAATVHVLIVPKKHIENLNALDDAQVAGKLLTTVPKIAKLLGIENAYRTVINTGPGAGQSVFHVHIHLLGGKSLGWPQ